MGSRSFLSVYTGYPLRQRRVSDKSHQTHSDDFAWLFDMLQISKKYFWVLVICSTAKVASDSSGSCRSLPRINLLIKALECAEVRFSPTKYKNHHLTQIFQSSAWSLVHNFLQSLRCAGSPRLYGTTSRRRLPRHWSWPYPLLTVEEKHHLYDISNSLLPSF